MNVELGDEGVTRNFNKDSNNVVLDRVEMDPTEIIKIDWFQRRQRSVATTVNLARC